MDVVTREQLAAEGYEDAYDFLPEGGANLDYKDVARIVYAFPDLAPSQREREARDILVNTWLHGYNAGKGAFG